MFVRTKYYRLYLSTMSSFLVFRSLFFFVFLLAFKLNRNKSKMGFGSLFLWFWLDNWRKHTESFQRWLAVLLNASNYCSFVYVLCIHRILYNCCQKYMKKIEEFSPLVNAIHSCRLWHIGHLFEPRRKKKTSICGLSHLSIVPE